MIEFDSPDEARLWDKLCEDPLYPCAKCTARQNPPLCHTKKCGVWRNWWAFRFLQAKEMIKERGMK